MQVITKEQINEEIEKYLKWLTSIAKKRGITPKYNLCYIESVRTLVTEIVKKSCNRDEISEVLLYLERLSILYYRKRCKLFEEDFDM